MRSFEEVLACARRQPSKTVAVACAQDEEILRAVFSAKEEGIAEAILFGDRDAVWAVEGKLGIDRNLFPIVHEASAAEAAKKAVCAVSSGEADAVMKGHLDSSVFLKAVIDRETGLRVKGRTICTTAVLEIPGERLLFLSDPGFIPHPGLEEKKQIIMNNVEALRRLGISEPKVAVLSTAEKVNPKIPSSEEGAALQRMNEAGELPNCIVAGPISMDLAISGQAARIKEYHHPVGGSADLLVMPDLEVGNIVLKGIQYTTGWRTGGFVTGAGAPIIFTSRADTMDTKRNAIALAVLQA